MTLVSLVVFLTFVPFVVFVFTLPLWEALHEGPAAILQAPTASGPQALG